MSCKHNWELIDKTILPSAYEQLAEKHTMENIQAGSVTLFRKKIIYIFQCTDCKKIREIVEVNP